ncbi:MAG: glycoside hydrolase family 5 protein [Lachnospiraceae bacterium]|nr:glycoside hydrolase family 5 protein [Lachnospiraceae bacterium]
MKKVKFYFMALSLVLSLSLFSGCTENEVKDTVDNIMNAGNETVNETVNDDLNKTVSEENKDTASDHSNNANSGEKADENKVATSEKTEENNDVKQEKTGFASKKLDDVTAVEFATMLGNGINLGNTMEAYARKYAGLTAPISAYESAWGQPKTTKAMIEGMKAAGFDVIRIPVAWTNTMHFEVGDYTISSAYLDRVEEIVNYALESEMYVIINDHWDGGWWGMFGSASEETRKKAMDLYISMWTQIAERFKDYGDCLIFEGGNEEIGSRLNDMDYCPDGNTLSDSQCYAQANVINQAFVDLIRSMGGNNANRFLLIPGFNTDIDRTNDKRWKMPTDSAKNRLLVSVHYYTPWGYCGNESLASWGLKKDYEEQNNQFKKMAHFVDEGYGVIIGEYAVAFGADGKIKANTADFIQNLLDNCDIYGYCPVLWDCNGLYNKQKKSIIDKDIAKLYSERRYTEEIKKADSYIEEAKERMENAYALAKKDYVADLKEDDVIAWIMFNSSDWTMTYSTGDKYSPDQLTGGMKANDAIITEKGQYTVSLDFTGTSKGYAQGTAFCALGMANGEKNYPGCVLVINEIAVNGVALKLKGQPYTTSDDEKCTRVNIYNAWVPSAPSNGRTASGSLVGATPILIDTADLDKVKTLSVTFTIK